MAVVEQFTFKQLVLKNTPAVGGKRESEENGFWKRFQFPIVAKESAAVTSVHFSPSEPYDYAVTAGSKVQVYSSVTNEVKKSVSRFEVAAYSGCIRHDGQLLVAGSEGGVVKTFDLNSRAVLRQCKGHAKAVKTVGFSLNGLQVISGSDDTTVRQWDLATGSCIATLRGHTDYVRCVLCTPSSSDLVLSGSYDHTLRLWDLRSGSTVWECDHGVPVEYHLMFPSGGAAVSAGGSEVRVWDVLRGSSRGPLVSFSNHQKTVTALAFDGTASRLLSGGLDRQLKVYSVQDYSVIHSMSYPAPILSLAMSPTDSHLVVGMSNRLLSIKHRVMRKLQPSSSSSSSSSLTRPPRAGSYRYFVRGKNYHPGNDEYIVSVSKKRRLSDYESLLRSFQYKAALTRSLKLKWKGNPAVVKVIYSLIQELVRRNGLSIALSGRTEKELYPLLLFLRFQVLQPKYTSFMLDVLDIVIDMYGQTLNQSDRCAGLINIIQLRLKREIAFQRKGFELLGTVDALMTAAMATQRNAVLGESSWQPSVLGGGGDVHV